ncbi:c-type cytochrome [Halovulum sp. GXIMD14794]
MRLFTRIAGGVLAVGLLGAAAIAAWPIGTAPPNIPMDGDAEAGAYLARASGCISCHTSVAGGGAPLAGGTRFDTPFGAVFAPNLTTDAEHGIGAWTSEDFAKAVRQGISPDGEPYYPAFVYPFYGTFTDRQIADLWAAFQTVPAVSTPSKAPEMQFPFDQRWMLKVWRGLFLERPRTDPVAGKSDSWNRGKALVEGASHCGACHTGRNFLGAREVENEKFAGSDMLPGGGKAPPIDAASLRYNGWTEDRLAYALRTGIMPDGDAFGSLMGEVVMQGTRFLSDADLAAMAEYLIDAEVEGS